MTGPAPYSLGRDLAALCILASVIAGCSRSGSGTSANPVVAGDADHVVNLYIWSDYLAPDTLSSFEKQTGIKVHVSYFDSNEALEARMLAGHSGFDVVLPTSGTFLREIHSGAYQPLDKSRLPNLAHFDPVLLSQASISDPGNAYGVVYTWSTVGIGYNKKMIADRSPNATLSSWRSVLDPAAAAKWSSCGLNFVDDSVAIIQIVLKYLGRDPGKPSLQDYADVEKVLMKVRPFVRNIDTSGEIEAIANGDICISLGYSGDFVQASKRAKEAKNGIELDYVIPVEGSLEGFDLLAIPKDAPHVANGYQLVNYLMDPHVLAHITDAIGFANANLAATPLLDPSITSDTIIYPTQEQQQRLIAQTEVSGEQSRTITRIWQRFKTGQ